MKSNNWHERKCSELLDDIPSTLSVLTSRVAMVFFFLAFVVEPEFLDSGKKPEPYVGVAWLCSPLAGRWFQHWWALLYSKLTGTVTSLAKTGG